MTALLTDRPSRAGHHRAGPTRSLASRGPPSLLAASRRQIRDVEAKMAIRFSTRRMMAANRPHAPRLEIYTETNSRPTIDDHVAATPDPLACVNERHAGRPDATLVRLQTSAWVDRLRTGIPRPPPVRSPVIRDMAWVPLGARLPPSAISLASVAGKQRRVRAKAPARLIGPSHPHHDLFLAVALYRPPAMDHRLALAAKVLVGRRTAMARLSAKPLCRQEAARWPRPAIASIGRPPPVASIGPLVAEDRPSPRMRQTASACKTCLDEEVEVFIHKVAAAARSATSTDNDLLARTPAARLAEASGRPLPSLTQPRPPRRLLTASAASSIRRVIISSPLDADAVRISAPPWQWS